MKHIKYPLILINNDTQLIFYTRTKKNIKQEQVRVDNILVGNILKNDPPTTSTRIIFQNVNSLELTEVWSIIKEI